jgi:ribonuclease P protein component
MPSHKFPNNERLKSTRRIAALFREAESFAQYPLRIIWKPAVRKSGEAPVQFALSVAKKKFPKAVNRNRIRRLVREAWRLNKHLLEAYDPEENTGMDVMMLYVTAEELPFTAIDAACRQIIKRLLKKWKKGEAQY